LLTLELAEELELDDEDFEELELDEIELDDEEFF